MERKNRGSFSTLSNRRTRRRCSGVPTCPVHCLLAVSQVAVSQVKEGEGEGKGEGEGEGGAEREGEGKGRGEGEGTRSRKKKRERGKEREGGREG